MEIKTHSVDETYDLASKIANQCHGGEIIILNGDLGAGKTTFTKGFALALGVKTAVTSPTFTIMKKYVGRLTLYHFDMYRIVDAQELDELGFDDYIGEPDSVSIIEWNKISTLVDPIVIDLEYLGETDRKITVRGISL